MYLPYIEQYLAETKRVVDGLDRPSIERMIELLKAVRDARGRLFILGVGGGAGHASHAVNDFRKIAGIEAYTPMDNISEFSARVNDDGWEEVMTEWLKGSFLSAQDAVLVFSVGGGNAEKKISINIVSGVKYAKSVGAKVLGIVGRDGGYTKQVADACVVVPTVNADTVTPHTESFQAVIWHLIVSHPLFLKQKGKWESIEQTK
ncbi:MAG: SIS domain-containing protein [Candidatus Taylorbacteria bacterium]|nr:SIS domain-containing protein [Candidatus Taylorbacteria bacterium]